MPIDTTRPYCAHKSDSRWTVIDSRGKPLIFCDCKHDANWYARQLNEAEHHARIAAMISLLSRGPITGSFIPPDDEFYLSGTLPNGNQR